MEKMFYRVVTHAVLLFGLETSVILAAINRTMEGTHIGFLRHITGKLVQRKADGAWVMTRAEVE